MFLKTREFEEILKGHQTPTVPLSSEFYTHCGYTKFWIHANDFDFTYNIKTQNNTDTLFRDIAYTKKQIVLT
jgi:hypothetical protein